MKQDRTTDMTVGRELPQLLRFAVPVMLGSFFQQLYNLADMSIAGYTLGDHAIAAISSTHAIVTLITAVSLGFSIGNSILISESLGAGDKTRTKAACSAMLIISLSIAFLFTSLLLFLIDPILSLINTPESVYEDARRYILIIITFLFTTVLYNMLASMFRALGNSFIPLLFLIFSSLLNIFFDWVFMGHFGWGVAGAAYATALSQAISVVLSFLCFQKSFPSYRINLRELRSGRTVISRMLPLGISAALTNSLFSIGSIAVQGAVNALGEDIIIAQAAAQKIESFAIIPSSGIANSCAAFTAQNHGAGKNTRIRKATRLAVTFSAFCNVISYTLIWLFGTGIIEAITNTGNETVAAQGEYMLRIVVAFITTQTVTMVYRMSLQSMQYKLVPLIGTGIELAARIFSAFFLAPAIGFTGICVAEPLSWVISGLVMFACFIRVMRQTPADTACPSESHSASGDP